jgi:hypothetical protein
MTPEELKQAMKDPGNHVHAITMTPEMKARLTKICDHMMDELIKNTQGPFEAYIALHFMMTALEAKYDFRGGALDDAAHS